MILVLNRRRRLSGNRFLILVLVILLGSCSKKIVPVSTPSQKPEPEKDLSVKKEELKAVAVHSVALLLPFHLDQINPKTADRKSIRKADLAIDFYQGFKLALDSLSAEGYNYKLQVFDTQENELQLVNLARARSVLTNDLIVGPVFPVQIKTFSEFADLKDKLQISPLAASNPTQFNNSKLVTLTNNIDQHAHKIADFINRNYKPGNVNIVVINTQRNDEEKFSAPFKNYLIQLSSNAFVINERSNSIGLEEHLSSTKTNLVIIASDLRDFLLPTIDRLYKVSQTGSKIEVFGHPNWAKAQFLNAEKMQWLNTRISSSYFVDFKSTKVKNFIARYLVDYKSDPGEYAFKGFDTGYYFGKLLASYGEEYAKHLTEGKYEGLHNDFRFVEDMKTGFLNTELKILKYQGFELQVEK